MHTHTTTIFPSRLPTFRHLPRTIDQAGHRRVIAVSTAAIRVCRVRPSVGFVLLPRDGGVRPSGRDTVRGSGGGANTRERGTSSPGSMGLCTMNQFFPLYRTTASAPSVVHIYMRVHVCTIIICSVGRLHTAHKRVTKYARINKYIYR